MSGVHMGPGERRTEPEAGRRLRRGSARASVRVLAGAVCCGLLAGAWATAARAQAQSASAASATADYAQLIERAINAFADQRFEQARNLFEQAHALAPSARTLRGLGVTAFALNRYTQARPELEAALGDPRTPLTLAQQREVKGILDWMQANLGTLHLQLSPPYANAMVDERPVTKGTNLLEPGQHSLHIQANEYATHDENFVLEREKPLDLRVELAALPSAAAALEPAPVAPAQPAPVLAQHVDAGAAQRDHASGSSSVFERWWFWTLAGVVVAGAVIAVVGLTQEPSARALPAGVRIGTH